MIGYLFSSATVHCGEKARRRNNLFHVYCHPVVGRDEAISPLTGSNPTLQKK
jgi:hypothetical protein